VEGGPSGLQDFGATGLRELRAGPLRWANVDGRFMTRRVVTTVTKGISHTDLDFGQDGGTLSFGQRRGGACARTGDGAGLPGNLRAGGGAVDDGSAAGSAAAQPAAIFVSGGAAGRVHGVCGGGVAGGVAIPARMDRADVVDGRNSIAAGGRTGGLRGGLAAPAMRGREASARQASWCGSARRLDPCGRVRWRWDF
jgi:hypothetical protein